MVVLTHSALPIENPTLFDSLFLSSLSYINAPGIGIFFLISGALLLPSNTSSYKEFFSKRLPKVIFPTIFWTIIYIAINYFSGNNSVSQTITAIFSMPFSAQGSGILWYMYTLIGIYLLIPILSPWIKSATHNQILLYIGLWSITLMYPYIELILSIDRNITGILYYFTGYIGYFVLGSFFAIHMKNYNHPILYTSILIIALAIPIPIKLIGLNVDFYTMLWYLSMPVAIMSASWFLLARNIPKPSENSLFTKFIRWLSPMTFGIYLSHILLRDLCHNYFSGYSVVTGTLLTAISLLISAIIICELLRKLHISKYTIGI